MTQDKSKTLKPFTRPLVPDRIRDRECRDLIGETYDFYESLEDGVFNIREIATAGLVAALDLLANKEHPAIYSDWVEANAGFLTKHAIELRPILQEVMDRMPDSAKH